VTVVCVAHIVGGIVANGLLALLSPGHLEVDLILGEGTSRTQGLFIEMFTTANLCLSVLMLGAEKHLLTPHGMCGLREWIRR
jgi:aquaporin related protein